MFELTDEQHDQLSCLSDLRTALGSLHHARTAIKLPEIIPESDIARHWLLITGIFSLLEQSLKFLHKLTKPNYGDGQMRSHGHDLPAVYQDLQPEHQQDLRQYFDEYASLLGITDLGGLDEYLKEKGGKDQHGKDRYQRWRYFLIERSLEKLDQGQTGPLHPDLLLEVITGALDLASNHIYGHRRINSVSHRLENRITKNYALFGDGGGIEDIQAWRNDNPYCINACSRWLRAADLDTYASPFMRNWITDTMSRSVDVDTTRDQAMGLNRNLGIAYDMEIFKRRARRSCFMWDGKKFVSRNPRPAPVREINLQGEWSMEWKSNGVLWTGCLNRAVTQIPARPGQIVRVGIQGALQDEDGNPMGADDLSSQPVGDLALKMDGKLAVEMSAQLYHPSGGAERAGDGTPFGYSISFIKTDDNGEYEQVLYSDFQCVKCRGTGFCSVCLGESEDGVCRTGGLCGDCRGYGEDGQHLLAVVAEHKRAMAG